MDQKHFCLLIRSKNNTIRKLWTDSEHCRKHFRVPLRSIRASFPTLKKKNKKKIPLKSYVNRNGRNREQNRFGNKTFSVFILSYFIST